MKLYGFALPVVETLTAFACLSLLVLPVGPRRDVAANRDRFRALEVRLDVGLLSRLASPSSKNGDLAPLRTLNEKAGPSEARFVSDSDAHRS